MSDASSLPARDGQRRGVGRWLIAATVLLIALGAATAVPVASGTAGVITRFGEPVRVALEPGLTWKAPPPLDRVDTVDLRLRTTASGQHSVLTRDGLSILLQGWIAWRVPTDEAAVLRFVRATRNRPDEAANHLRTFLGSALETVTGRFDLDSLLNTDATKLKRSEFRAALHERLAEQARSLYGIEIVQVGLERLMIPETTVTATTKRMVAERETVAEEKKAYGRRMAGEIRAKADKEARLVQATAQERAAGIDAEARTAAAAIYAEVHRQDPQLYRFLRSLETLDQVVNTTTRLIVRTDAAPFDALVLPPAGTQEPPARATP
jgi:membrane protease subunit HflC